MKVTVCQLNDESSALAYDWAALVTHVKAEASQLVLLPEMPFYPWFAASRSFQSEVWDAAVRAHEKWQERFPELAPATILGSRPVNRGGVRNNEGFLWSRSSGYLATHLKYYLPDEVGYWEASWYTRGDGSFEPVLSDAVGVGFTICTDLWFLDQARRYGQRGVHILANPRATERATNEKWLTGGRAAAIVSGAYSLSSNRVSAPTHSQPFGGQGWIVDPDGAVIGVTSVNQPFLTLDIDLRHANDAKSTYPRYAIFDE